MASTGDVQIDGPLLDALAAAVELPLDPRYRAGVGEALARMLALGRIVAAAVTPGETEPAPLFKP